MDIIRFKYVVLTSGIVGSGIEDIQFVGLCEIFNFDKIISRFVESVLGTLCYQVIKDYRTV